MDTLLKDLRYSIRTLARRPAFTGVVVLTLALGIGANTAIFSVVNAVLLAPLPFKDAGRLVAVMEFNPKSFNEPIGASYPDFKDWQDQNNVFEQVAGITGQSLTLTGGEEPLRLSGQSVSAGFFPMLGAEPAVGRTFLPADEKPGQNKLVVLSYAFWQRRFAGDPAMVGRALILNGTPYTVVGVMRPGFSFLREVDLWTPFDVPAMLQRIRGARFLQVVAKLKPETSLDQARSEMTGIASRMQSDYAQSNSGWEVRLVPLQDKVVGKVRQSLLVLLAAVGFVLLVACANVASLLLTRGASRQKEMAIRLALGAGRARLIRSLLVESLFLALAGGCLGLLLSMWGIDALRSLSPPNLPRLEEVVIDRTVLGFTVLVSLVTGMLFGLAPVRQTTTVDLQNALKEGAGSSRPARRLFGGALVVSEIALSLILLIGTGLLARSLVAMLSVDRGFRTENLITMEISLPQYKYAGGAARQAFFQQLLERVESLPGVDAAAITSVLPLSSNNSKNTFSVEGHEGGDEWANLRTVSPDYFRAMGIPVLSGRPFTNTDDAGARDIVIVNELMAKRYWPDQDPIGQRILFGDSGSTITGVVGNIKHSGLDAELEPEMYVPFSQQPASSMVLVARAESNPLTLAGPLREIVRSIDQDQPVDNLRTMEDVVSSSVAQPRFLTIILIVFSTVAVALAAIGVYGVVAFSVARRTHEVGIRMAVGARGSDIMKLVLGEGLTLAVIGVAAGLLGSFALTRLISGMLYRVSPTDPVTFASISLLLTGVALAASFIPALRAMKVDPMIALRHE